MNNSQNKLSRFLHEASTLLLGKEEKIHLALTGLLCRGHILIEDVPGVGKTTLVNLMAKLTGLPLSRIQFTNDLLPSDIIGTHIFLPETQEFTFKKGPLFGQLILADELNRAPAKTQSALLQAMEEGKITVDGKEFDLGPIFQVMATQNPAQQIGTFPLPESQLDRFFLSLHLGFPERKHEMELLHKGDPREKINKLTPCWDKNDLLHFQEEVQKIHVSEDILNYALDLLQFGRSLSQHTLLSPRAGQDLISAARAFAFIKMRSYVIPEDIQGVALAVWGHRLGAGHGILYGQDLVTQILQEVAIP